jgi:transcriptional regulator with XRE-family HTH domain
LLVEVKVVSTAQTYTRESSFGAKVKRLRLSSLLTQKELADLAGVSQEEVNLFERGLPLPLDSKRKILKELWAKKAKK